MTARRVVVLSLFTGIAGLASVQDAEAGRRGLPLLIINTGEAIYPVADLPEDLVKDNPKLKGWQLGYRCSHFGVLWADIACWDKELVAFKDDTYSDLPPDLRAELEEEYPWSSTKRGAWNRFGIFAIGAVLGGGIVFKAKS